MAPGKRSETSDQTRENLKQAFLELYASKPIERISIREITDRAGYNRATFYLYYRDVYDLFDQLEEGVLSQVRALVDRRLLAGDTLDFSQHMGLIIGLAQRFDGFMPRLMAGDPSFGDRLKDIIAPLLDRFILPDEGMTDEERAIMREFYLSGLLAAVNTWMAREDRMPIDRLLELIVAAVAPGD